MTDNFIRDAVLLFDEDDLVEESDVCEQPGCCDDAELTATLVPEALPPLKVAPLRFEVELDFVDTTPGDSAGLWTDAIDTIYIENGELRLIDGPIAQVIELGDIKFMRISLSE